MRFADIVVDLHEYCVLKFRIELAITAMSKRQRSVDVNERQIERSGRNHGLYIFQQVEATRREDEQLFH